jgi:hypothetical protein
LPMSSPGSRHFRRALRGWCAAGREPA